MKNKFFLIGIPGSGKSTLGRRVADILQIPFFDTDTMVFNKLGKMGLTEVFRSSFDVLYVEEQKKAIAQFSEIDTPALIATGAEVGLMPYCVRHMDNIGYTIHIKRDPEKILEHLRNDGESGLTLRNEADGTEIVMREEAVRLYAKNLSKYREAALLMLDNNGSEDEGVEKLSFLIEKLIQIQ